MENVNMTNVDFRDEELQKLRDGECIEKEINGEKLFVCGTKMQIKRIEEE